ncbi:hypothetical protein INR49_005622 [Caranx melampygus]|nr:hypothetical protein INR49_005622 [Caranx melampygus]
MWVGTTYNKDQTRYYEMPPLAVQAEDDVEPTGWGHQQGVKNSSKEDAIFTAPLCSCCLYSIVNPLQCAYLRELVREGGETVISEIDAGQMLHFSHGVRQFGENIALQVQFCKKSVAPVQHFCAVMLLIV